MAATDGRAGCGPSILAAALALPVIGQAQVLPVPGPSSVQLRWLGYRDWQPGLDRIRVQSPAVVARYAHDDRWTLEAGALADHVSGASPRYHTAVSGASRMDDRRTATYLRWTRHEERRAVSWGLAHSQENDYRSTALSTRWAWARDDQNLGWSAGLNVAHDRIGSADAPRFREERQTTELLLGLTQVPSRNHLLQALLSVGHSRGYHGDPYKTPDLRPPERRWSSLTLRWNQAVADSAWTLRSHYRHYQDSFGIRSHTLGLEATWVSPSGWRWTPLWRLYTQDAARFYYNPVYAYQGVPLPPEGLLGAPNWNSADQRLSAFGSAAIGLRTHVSLTPRWNLDARLERYEQRTAWHWRTPGSRGLEPLSALMVQLGVERTF